MDDWQLLDPHAHGKILRQDRKALLQKHPVGISRAVTDGKDAGSAGDLPPIGEERNDPSARRPDFLHFRAVKDLPAQRPHALLHAVYHFAQTVGADMGLCQRQEAFRRAELHQPRKNVSAKGIVHPRHAFSVRKAARAPGAELDITVFVKDLFSEEPGGRRLRSPMLPPRSITIGR